MKPRIAFALLEDMFANIAAKTPWDMSRPMLWGYFFTHREPQRLEAAKGVLESRGYRFVKIYLADRKEQDAPDVYWLHVEMEEVHTPASLQARNDDLYRLADELNLDSYDGMDVGPLPRD